MNRDDIVAMALESGFERNSLGWSFTSGRLDYHLERFAALVAAAKLDECILMLERLHERSGGQYNYYLHAAKVLKGEV
jgi:hypothetical protein